LNLSFSNPSLSNFGAKFNLILTVWMSVLAFRRLSKPSPVAVPAFCICSCEQAKHHNEADKSREELHIFVEKGI